MYPVLKYRTKTFVYTWSAKFVNLVWILHFSMKFCITYYVCHWCIGNELLKEATVKTSFNVILNNTSFQIDLHDESYFTIIQLLTLFPEHSFVSMIREWVQMLETIIDPHKEFYLCITLPQRNDSCYDVNIQALGKFNHNALIKLVSVPRQESDWQFICVLRVSRTDNIMVKRKRTNNDLQSITQETKDRVTRTPLKTGGELSCSRKGNQFLLH
jgi:hypothetical protein